MLYFFALWTLKTADRCKATRGLSPPAGLVLPLFIFILSSSCSNLSNNRITDIEEGTFEGASGVNELILTSNRLENIHHRMLKGLGGLRTLWVHTRTHTRMQS